MELKTPIKNFGLIVEPHDDKDYEFLGATPLVGKAIFADGHGWGNYLPFPEMQFTENTDFMDCVTESLTNSIEMQLKCLYNVDENKSERYTAKLSGTTRQGNSQRNVVESARKDGLVPEGKWPRNRTMTWETYYASIPTAIRLIGNLFTKKWIINYEWVPTTKEALKEALKYAPVQVTGYAWAQNNGIYYDYGYRPNHAFVLYDYVDGEKWRCFDSYPTDFVLDENSTRQEFIKELDWNFNFGDAMKITIKPVPSSTPIIIKLLNMLKNLWSYVDSKGVYSYFVKIDEKSGKPVGKQKIDRNKPGQAVDLILTLLRESGLSKTTDWGALSQIPSKDFVKE